MNKFFPIAKSLAEKIRIPLLGGDITALIIAGILSEISRIIALRYQVNMEDYVLEQGNGFQLDLDEIREDLVTVLNAEIDLPLLGEESEGRLFDSILFALQDAGKVGNAIPIG